MTFFPSLFLSFFLSSSSPSGHFVPISSLRQHLVSILCNLSKKAVKRPTDLVYANGPFVRNQHPKPPSHAPSHSPRTLRRRKGEKKKPKWAYHPPPTPPTPTTNPTSPPTASASATPPLASAAATTVPTTAAATTAAASTSTSSATTLPAARATAIRWNLLTGASCRRGGG